MNNYTSKQISIVIPTRNERFFIDRCLNSVFNTVQIPYDMEVIVVDGISNDGTRRILDVWREKKPNLQIIDNPKGIVSSALNIGIRASQGKWIFILGAHAEYHPDYFKFCLEEIAHSKAKIVGGVLITCARNNSLIGKMIQAITTHRFGIGNASFRTGAHAGWKDTVPYGCYERDIFEKIGLFDERLIRNQDYEFNRRWTSKGGRIWFNPKIKSWYYNQSSIKGLLRQAFHTGKWNPWTWYVARYSFAWRHLIPMAFVMVIFFLLTLARVNLFYGIWGLCTVLIPYFLLACLASYQQSIRYGKRIFPFLPLFFLTYHFAYGLGGVWGLLLLMFRKAPVQMSFQ